MLMICVLQVAKAHALTLGLFPSLSGNDLNNKPWSAPSGFPAERTLVVIGFEEEQQIEIDSWFQGMNVGNPSSQIKWIEMPLINNPGVLMRWFINTGMKAGIRSKAVRSHVWTAYTDKRKFMQACGMPSTKDVYALVVDRAGRILAMESGEYTKAGGDRLLQYLNPPQIPIKARSNRLP